MGVRSRICTLTEFCEAGRLPAMKEPRAHARHERARLGGTALVGLLTLSVAAFLSAGCAIQGRSVSAVPQLRQLPYEDSQVVDCLLPPQIRRLGSQVTYLSARQAIETSASDCEIRGGSPQD